MFISLWPLWPSVIILDPQGRDAWSGNNAISGAYYIPTTVDQIKIIICNGHQIKGTIMISGVRLSQDKYLFLGVQSTKLKSAVLEKSFPPPSLALLNFQCKYPTIDLLPNVLSDTPPFNVKLLLQLSAIQQKNWTTILLTLFFFWVVQDSSIGDLVSEWVRQSVSQTFDFSITMTNND